MESDFKVGDLVFVRYRRTKQLWPAQISECNWRHVNYRGLFKKTDGSYRKSGRFNGKFSPSPKPVERYCFLILNADVQKWADADDIFAFSPARVCPLDPVSPDFQRHQTATKLALDLYYQEHAVNAAPDEFGINSHLVAPIAETPQPLQQPGASETVNDTASNRTEQLKAHLLSGENAGPISRKAGHAVEQREDPEIELNVVDTKTENNTSNDGSSKDAPLVLPIVNPPKEHPEELYIDNSNQLALESTVHHTTGKHTSHASPASMPSQLQNQPEDAETGKDCVDPGASSSCPPHLPVLCATSDPSAITAHAVSGNDFCSVAPRAESQQEPELGKTGEHSSAKWAVNYGVTHQDFDSNALSPWVQPSGPAPDSSMLNWGDVAIHGANLEGDVLSPADPNVQPLPLQLLVCPTAPDVVPSALTPKSQSVPLVLGLCPSAANSRSVQDLKNAHDGKHITEITKREALPCPPYVQVQKGEGSGSSDGQAIRDTKSSSLIGGNTFSQPGGGTEASTSVKDTSVGSSVAPASPAAQKGKRGHRGRSGQLSVSAEVEREIGGETAPVPETNFIVRSNGTRTGSGERTVDAALASFVKVEVEEARTIDESTKNEEKNPTARDADDDCNMEAKPSPPSMSLKTFAGDTENKDVQDTSHAALLTYPPSTLVTNVENAARAGQNAFHVEPKEEIENGNWPDQEDTKAPEEEQNAAVHVAKDRDITLGDLVFAKYCNNPYWPGVIVTSNWRRSFGKWKRKKPNKFFCSFIGPEDCAWVHAKHVQLYDPADAPQFQVPKMDEMHSEQKAAIQAATEEYFARKAKTEKMECSAEETAASEGSSVADSGTGNVPDFKLGDIVMAKVMGYPYWPGRIDLCPWKEERFHEKWMMNDPVRIWCLFVDNSGNWVDIEYVKPFTPEAAEGYLSETKPDPDQKAAIEVATKLYYKIPSTELGEDGAETNQRSSRRRKWSDGPVRGIRKSKRRRSAPLILNL